ncbi:hypothetical protein PYW08_001797 [Mythimna loreyi]|uniref:Uncharacterized protein n=1 Tax=Mythimna loreyi TaxID=667449 RepID=A0ACC2R6F5_9NEOP|nr:hypothetical protein PYW08_001797 [Mythimna loreyi]
MFVGFDFVLLWICVACLTSSQAAPVSTQGPQLYLDLIDMAAVNRRSSQQPEGFAEGQTAREMKRTKRSFQNVLVSKASAGIQNRDKLVAQASAFINPASSKTSAQNNEDQKQDVPQQDTWNIKESVMYSLFQAANAISGGATILKGQLIRGSGALAVSLGKVISVDEEAVDNPDNKLDSSTKLWTKKPHTTAVSGAPRTSHLQYKRRNIDGAPSMSVVITTPPIFTSYAAYRYPSQLDGRHKIIGFHASFFLAPTKSPDYEYIGHTPLELPFRTVNWWK